MPPRVPPRRLRTRRGKPLAFDGDRTATMTTTARQDGVGDSSSFVHVPSPPFPSLRCQKQVRPSIPTRTRHLLVRVFRGGSSDAAPTPPRGVVRSATTHRGDVTRTARTAWRGRRRARGTIRRTPLSASALNKASPRRPRRRFVGMSSSAPSRHTAWTDETTTLGATPGIYETNATPSLTARSARTHPPRCPSSPIGPRGGGVFADVDPWPAARAVPRWTVLRPGGGRSSPSTSPPLARPPPPPPPSKGCARARFRVLGRDDTRARRRIRRRRPSAQKRTRKGEDDEKTRATIEGGKIRPPPTTAPAGSVAATYAARDPARWAACATTRGCESATFASSASALASVRGRASAAAVDHLSRRLDAPLARRD